MRHQAHCWQELLLKVIEATASADPALLNVKDSRGRGAVHLAALEGKSDAISKLAAAKADLR